MEYEMIDNGQQHKELQQTVKRRTIRCLRKVSPAVSAKALSQQ